jgi:hypothetical protein
MVAELSNGKRCVIKCWKLVAMSASLAEVEVELTSCVDEDGAVVREFDDDGAT